MLDDYPEMVRVNRRNPCPICGKPDWCGYSDDGHLAVCMRVAEGSRKTTQNGGYLHVLRDDPDWRMRPKPRTVNIKTPHRAGTDFGQLAAECAAAVDLADLQDFAEELGLSVKSLARLRVGWAEHSKAWSFPMLDADGRVCGIRLRSWAARTADAAA